ncbi:hypothetical protein Y88_2358 [Novosphingobium nitrogenifigens DSM 19370]|uniref:Uncharacterized protein n=1 Tax=Novosphingobium nitrogenifigens DSM 19370 TaxID=983920 RepID=F1Z6D5_9SPHN|nr:hypothetical protein Y88_2358 [Novosphingobium nitrogenifigens DSM 19370]
MVHRLGHTVEKICFRLTLCLRHLGTSGIMGTPESRCRLCRSASLRPIKNTHSIGHSDDA